MSSTEKETTPTQSTVTNIASKMNSLKFPFPSISKTLSSAKKSIKGMFSPVPPEEGLPAFSPLPPEKYDPVVESSSKAFTTNPARCKALFKRMPSLDSVTDDMDLYLKRYINYNNAYTIYYNWLKHHNPIAYEAIVEYQYDSSFMYKKYYYDKMYSPLYNLFTVPNGERGSIPGLPHSIYVYRCYKNKTLKSIENHEKEGRFLSTTLSQRFANDWCKKVDTKNRPCHTEDKYLEVCIIIPKGTKVLPFVYMNHFNRFNEYEILLPPLGKLVMLNICHPRHNIPVYVYYQNTDEVAEYLEEERLKEERENRQKEETEREAMRASKEKEEQESMLTELKEDESITYPGIEIISHLTNLWEELLNNNNLEYERYLEDPDCPPGGYSAYGGKTRKRKTQKKRRRTRRTRRTRMRMKSGVLRK